MALALPDLRLTRGSHSSSGAPPSPAQRLGGGRVSDEGRRLPSLGETPLRVLSLEPWGHKLSQTGGVNTVRCLAPGAVSPLDPETL